MSETVCAVETTRRQVADFEKVRMVRGREETKLERALRLLRQPQRAIQTLERISRMAEGGGSVQDAYVTMTSALGCVQKGRIKEFADQLRRDPDVAMQMAQRVAGFGE